MKRLTARNVLRRCCNALLMPGFWMLFTFARLALAISCLTSQCVLVMIVLLRNYVGVMLRLQIAINRTFRRRHSRKRVASIFWDINERS